MICFNPQNLKKKKKTFLIILLKNFPRDSRAPIIYLYTNMRNYKILSNKLYITNTDSRNIRLNKDGCRLPKNIMQKA